MELTSALNTVFSEREKFVIIGLTGRTGSGCSTVAEVLSQETFENFNPPSAVEDAKEDEIAARKYKITYKYLQNNWGKFYHIKVRDVICSFVLESDFNNFIANYCSLIDEDQNTVSEKIENSLKEKFNLFNSKITEIKTVLERSEIDSIKNLVDDEIYNFCNTLIPDFTSELKNALENIKKGSYTQFFQQSANNIRRSGEAYSDKFNPRNIHKLSQRVNSIIKLLRIRNEKLNKRTLICIDSIRNPFEAVFFRDRYPSFYLISISTKNLDREKRLSELDLSASSIRIIDSKESPKKTKNEEIFYSQNIQKCIEISDIHIFNKQDEEKRFRALKIELVKYLSLIMHPGIITPSKSERCMQIAYTSRLNSGCISRQVGAVVTDKNYSIKAVGWNDTAYGQIPCSLRNVSDLVKGSDAEAFSEYEKKDNDFQKIVSKVYEPNKNEELLCGKPFCFCFKDIKNFLDDEKNQVHTRALHAEENAFLQLSKYGGIGIENGILFSTASPCELCSKKAYQLGIKKIYYVDPYPGIAEDQILKIGKDATRPNLILFTGAVGRSYEKLYSPVIPYKEEIEMLLNLDMKNSKSEQDIKTKIKKLEDEARKLKEELSRRGSYS